jgi:hypothetical protein
MNLLPVLRPIERVSRGVLVGGDGEDLELLGAGPFGPRRRIVRVRRAGRMTSLGRESAAIRIARMQRGQVYSIMPSRFQKRSVMPPEFAAGLHGFELDGLGRLRLGKTLKRLRRLSPSARLHQKIRSRLPARFRRFAPGLHGLEDFEDPEGLGRLRLGKKLRKLKKVAKKIVKSKAFKYAAIATAAYFTGGAALKFAAPMIKKLAASKLASRIGKKIGKAGPLLVGAGGPSPQEAAYPEGYEQPGTLYPGAPAAPWFGGGGGGYEVPQEVYEPGQEQPEGAPVQLAGMGGGTALLIGGGLVVAMLASGGRRRRR